MFHLEQFLEEKRTKSTVKCSYKYISVMLILMLN